MNNLYHLLARQNAWGNHKSSCSEKKIFLNNQKTAIWCEEGTEREKELSN